VNIGLVQYDPLWEDKEGNKEKLIRLLCNGSSNLDLLIFPELTLTGFTMRSKRFAEELDGDSKEFFAKLANTNSCDIFYGFIEVNQGNFYNTLVHLAADGQPVCTYKKIHPFSFTGENRHYSSGISPTVTTINDFSIGLSICYDLRFPELYRHYAKKRVDLIVDIANWPVDRIEHWYSLLKARAIENQCYCIGVNRVGRGKSIDYPGWSSVFHPFGEELLCFKQKEGVKSLGIDQKVVKNSRDKFPFLNDIRLI
jgi:predicted amidohydrolase